MNSNMLISQLDYHKKEKDLFCVQYATVVIINVSASIAVAAHHIVHL